MLISERIFLLMDKNGLSQKEFSEQTGISQNPSADKILKICEVLHITPNELLAEGTVHDDGRMDYVFALNKDEEVVLESFRSLESRQKERLLGYMNALKENK